MILNVSPLMKAIEAFIKKADNDLEEQLDSEGYVAVHEAVEAIERIDDGIHNALDRNTDRLLSELENSDDVMTFIEETWPDVKDSGELEEELRKMFRKEFDSLFRTMVTNWFLREDEALAVDDRVTLRAADFINSWSAELAKLMKLSTGDQIENILSDAAKEHQSIADVMNKIGTSGIRDCGYRSRRVAVTEVLRVESYSQLEYMRQDPAVNEKEWLHTGSHKNKPRENHVAINGQRKPIEEPFELDGYRPMCPRDTLLPASESVNCHCLMVPRKSKTILNLSDEERRDLREKYMNRNDVQYLGEREREYGVQYGEDAITADRNLIESDAMRKKFNGLGANKNVDDIIYEKAKSAVLDNSGTKKESMYLIDMDDGTVLASIEKEKDKIESGIIYTDEFRTAIESGKSSNRRIISIHNHPEGYPPSADDLKMAKNNGYTKSVAFGHNGQLYLYSNDNMDLSDAVCDNIHEDIIMMVSGGVDIDRAYTTSFDNYGLYYEILKG